jgi:adenosylcobinamide-phosphate synthase
MVKVTAKIQRRARAVAVGLLLDRVFGEPPAEMHPVSVFGSLMGSVEDVTYDDDRGHGSAYAAVGVIAGIAAGRIVGSVATTTALAVSGKELRGSAALVRDALLAADLDRARERLRALVGRDPSVLDASGIAAATIESLAENTVDAVVAPAFWALVAGAPGVFAHRAINTMDSMVGYHSEQYEQFGWAAARLDDIAAYVPARITVGLVMAARPHVSARVLRVVRRDAGQHPSPNAGVAESAFAGALGLRLGGPIKYADREEDRPFLGDGRRPDVRDIDSAIALASHTELALVSGLLAVGLRGVQLEHLANRVGRPKLPALRRRERE